MAADDGLPPDPFHEASEVREAVASAMAGLESAMIFELVASYKAHMVEVGFSDAAAEQMAVDYHRGIVS